MDDAVPAVTQEADERMVAEFLTCALAQPSVLVVEGDAGVGKTTLWLAAVVQARRRGYHVLSTRPTEAETVLAYASLADLLIGVDETILAALPAPQRLAIDRVVLRSPVDGLAADQRAVAAGFLTIVEQLARDRPVMVAIDDLQWLDPSSSAVIAFATRRFSMPVGVLLARRTGGDVAAWLQLGKPVAVQRIQLTPMNVGQLHRVLYHHLGRSFPRPTIVQIHQVSGGNPFYALEIAHAMGEHNTGAEFPLPRSLNELLRTRLDGLNVRVQGVLLAAACLAEPTVELIGNAVRAHPDDVDDSLAEAEAAGIVVLDGNRIRFSHPLLARGVYTRATPRLRRDMHRRLAGLVGDAELRARHLALAAIRGDQDTLDALDSGAEMARIRGAPIAAAELLEFAMRLGGDTPDRQIRAAVHHFNAGATARARALLNHVIEQPAPKSLRAAALRLLGLWTLLDGSSRVSAELLNEALNDARHDPALRVQILVPLAHAQVNVRQLDDAASSIADAVRIAERIGQPQLLSQALAMHALVSFLLGDGLDESVLQRARELEDRESPITAHLDTTVQGAALMAASGRLDEAREELLDYRRRAIERGQESELLLFAFHAGLTEIWRGNFADCALIAEDVMERAMQLGGDLPRLLAPMLQSALAAYAGQEFEARRDAAEALAICHLIDYPFLVTVWPVTTLGFLEVSLGNYRAALDTLEPWLRAVEEAPRATEIFVAPFLPDAIEAMIQLGQVLEAQPLIDALERNGRRLNRPWMLAVGARGRAMLLAAQGDLAAAGMAAERAMLEHERLPMPFERARTQLLLGQIQRRRRQKGIASTTLREASNAFEGLGARLWDEKARAELARVKMGAQPNDALSASERRVAELAASGMTNREVAAALFISPKTVEYNLARVYRKLGIRSRAELGRAMGR